MNHDSLISIVTYDGVDDLCSNPSKGRDFSVRHHVQTGSGTHPASCLMCSGVSFPTLKRPERGIYHSPQSSVVVKSAWNCTPIPPYVSTVWRLSAGGILPFILMCALWFLLLRFSDQPFLIYNIYLRHLIT
jgi:hypothetical protein